MATPHCDGSRRFDPSMSRRTRKPVKISQQQQQEIMKDDERLLMFQSSMPVLQELIADNSSRLLEGKKAGEDIDRRQSGDFDKVTEEEEETAVAVTSDGEPEKKLAVIVAKKGGDLGGGGGVKIVEMVGRCVKTLNGLIRARRNHLKKKYAARRS